MPTCFPSAAYVHVPFCRHRCGYCDFTLVAGRDDLISAYLQALEIELSALDRPRPVQTLFLGGGTPTHLPPGALAQLLRLVRHWLPLMHDSSTAPEFSVEANPAGLDDERIALLSQAGVNRISLGVQSFDPRHLATLERDHTAHDVADVVARLQPHFANLSLDLIFAVPGQSLSEWEATLAYAIDLAPQHISTYGLTWERGTSFWSRRLHGALAPLDEETELAMYNAAIDCLAAAGYEHYELSNFARPGFRCRHNQVYWSGDAYYGFGPGAASYIDGVRRMNHRSTTTWLQRVLSGRSGLHEEERLNDEARAREAIMLGLRQRDGIDLARFEARYHCSPATLEPATYARHLAEGLCELSDGHWRLTRAGCCVADRVMSEYL